MVKVSHKGDFDNIDGFLKNIKEAKFTNILHKYGKLGVEALTAATPVDTGMTAVSWYYEIVEKQGTYTIHWCNSNLENGVPIAILIQYGHATKNGGYVQGRDFINPAMRSVFDKLADALWREVTKR